MLSHSTFIHNTDLLYILLKQYNSDTFEIIIFVNIFHVISIILYNQLVNKIISFYVQSFNIDGL